MLQHRGMRDREHRNLKNTLDYLYVLFVPSLVLINGCFVFSLQW